MDVREDYSSGSFPEEGGLRLEENRGKVLA